MLGEMLEMNGERYKGYGSTYPRVCFPIMDVTLLNVVTMCITCRKIANATHVKMSWSFNYMIWTTLFIEVVTYYAMDLFICKFTP